MVERSSMIIQKSQKKIGASHQWGWSLPQISPKDLREDDVFLGREVGWVAPGRASNALHGMERAERGYDGYEVNMVSKIPSGKLT
jgi:hypothetical protein